MPPVAAIRYLILHYGPIRLWIGRDTPANRRRRAELRRYLSTPHRRGALR